MRIILDAMGGDNAPEAPVRAAVSASRRGIGITLVGRESVINAELEKLCGSEIPESITVVNADEVIAMDEHPVTAVRRKKNSSLCVGLRLANEDRENSAFISGGSTGALLAGGLFVTGRIKGIDRPALAVALPTISGTTLLLDCGANAECKERNLLQFAAMGDVYARQLLGKEKPTIGLLNVGTEDTKGPSLQQEVCKQLREDKSINFIGNVEARSLPAGDCDVIVSDGFAGNIALKTYEGTAKCMMKGIKSVIMDGGIKAKLGGGLIKGSLGAFKARFDYKRNGGACLLGVDGIILKSHGDSDAETLITVIDQAVRMINGGFVGKLRGLVKQEAQPLAEEN